MRRYDTSAKTRIPDVMDALACGNIPYRIIEAQSKEEGTLVDWLESRFPFLGSGIGWSRIQGHRCVSWSTTGDLVPSFTRMAADIRPDTVVKVMWADALMPSLELFFGDVLRLAAPLFEASFDTWIICESENWCFEIYHEGTLCFGVGQVAGG